MKKIKLIITGIILTTVISFALVYSKIPKKVEANFYTNKEINYIKSMVKSSKVIAILKNDCYLYKENNENNKIQELYKDMQAEIIQDISCEWYKVRINKTGSIGWVKRENIIIPDTPKTNNNKMKKRYIEDYVNIMGFESNTDFLVWSDIDRQLVHIFKGKKNKWELLKTLTCSTGKNESPTTRGIFKTGDKGEWFYSERLGSGAKYWVRFNGSYLFHSVAMDKNKTIIDGILGERRSSGCIRLDIEDIKWFYDNIPKNTTVFIN